MIKTGIFGTLNRRAGYGGGNAAVKMLNTSVMSRTQSSIVKGGIGLAGLGLLGMGLSGLSSVTKSMREAPMSVNSAQPKIGMANINYSLGSDPFSGLRFAGRYRRNI